MMQIDNAIAGIAVRDLSEAAEWYKSLFGRSADSRPMDKVAEWKLPRGGWLQVYEAPERAGKGSVTLAVSDIEDAATDLEELGLEIAQRTSSPKANIVMVIDPDGNHVVFAEALDKMMAR